MSYKRVELYVWWTCNQKCTYCMEFPNMERKWKRKVTKHEILKDLIKYKKKGYNHVTLLWWEPFIQEVFYDSLKIAKIMWFTTLVTTNATTLHLDAQAKKYLPFIDELILSVQWVDKDLQQKISRTNVLVHWNEVFENIKKYWKGSFIKSNIVITTDNLPHIPELVEFSHKHWITNIAVTYPDLDEEYYTKEHLLESVAPKYSQVMQYINKAVDYSDKNKLNLKVVDIPFCIFPSNKREKYIQMTDDYNYENRVKISDELYSDNTFEDKPIERTEVLPRERAQVDACNWCIYNSICWWPAKAYKNLYGYSEINKITHNTL